jgi:hypothetical protein
MARLFIAVVCLLLLAACPAAALADDPDYVAPRAVDVVFSDVTELTFKGKLSESLNVAYLSRANVSSAWPVHGVLFGPRSRPVVSLPVHSARHASAPVVNVFFVVDTGAWSPVRQQNGTHRVVVGALFDLPPPPPPARASPCGFAIAASPYTFLAQRAYDALHVTSPSDDQHVRLSVNGVALKAYRSHARYEDVNVLGSDFLGRAFARITFDYADDVCSIDAQQPAALRGAAPAATVGAEL